MADAITNSQVGVTREQFHGYEGYSSSRRADVRQVDLRYEPIRKDMRIQSTIWDGFSSAAQQFAAKSGSAVAKGLSKVPYVGARAIDLIDSGIDVSREYERDNARGGRELQ